MTKEIKSNYKAIGIMAGSSMDGLDVAEVIFSKANKWEYEIGKCETYEYDETIEHLLLNASDESIESQNNTDRIFGEWIAKKLLDFGSNDCDLIAVHGHTVLHIPEEKISWQLGRGDVISNISRSVVVSDFRSEDVESGGQGAPLVPMGDFELFGQYDGCLNLGGIANLSIKKERIAWDICPCNQILNAFAKKLGHPFDKSGNLAASGSVNEEWVKALCLDPFFDKPAPKSLPNKFLLNLTDQVEPQEGLRSYCKFIADRILEDAAKYLKPGAKILVTGGGAFNSFLMNLLSENEMDFRFIVPHKNLVDFKEAVVFAFLGVLKLREEINVLSSVTGASRDNSSGRIHYPK